MKNIVLKFVLSIVFFVVVCSSLYWIAENGLKKYHGTSFDKFREMFSDNTYHDVLLLGSSRSHRNIDVRICDSVTRYSFYNGGISGAGGYEMLLALKGYLEVHPKPKFVLLNLDWGVLNTERIFFNSSFYFPFFENRKIFEAFNNKQYPVYLFKYLPFSRFIEFNDDLRLDALKGLFNKKENEMSNNHGYLVSYEKKSHFDTLYIKQKKENYYDVNSLMYIDSIVSVCLRNKINLHFFMAPAYNNHYMKSGKNYEAVINGVKLEYCKKYNIDLIRFDSLPINYNKNYFLDNIHLNKKGSEEFSLILAKKLRENILERRQ